MKSGKAVNAVKIGGDYTPPIIREVPTIGDGAATVFFKSPLSKGQRDSLTVCFRNFRTRYQVNPRLLVRNQAVVIDDATEAILRQALTFLEIDKLPEPRTPVTPKKAPAKKMSTAVRKQSPRIGLDMISQLAGLSG